MSTAGDELEALKQAFRRFGEQESAHPLATKRLRIDALLALMEMTPLAPGEEPSVSLENTLDVIGELGARLRRLGGDDYLRAMRAATIALFGESRDRAA